MPWTGKRGIILRREAQRKGDVRSLGAPMSPVVTPLLRASHLEASGRLFPKQVLNFTQENKDVLVCILKPFEREKSTSWLLRMCMENKNVMVGVVSGLISVNKMLACCFLFYQTKQSCHFVHLYKDSVCAP